MVKLGRDPHAHPPDERIVGRVLRSDVKYRFAVDMASLRSE
jgi:hypothetical protein